MNTHEILCSALARSAQEHMKPLPLRQFPFPWRIHAFHRLVCRPAGHTFLSHFSVGFTVACAAVFIAGLSAISVGLLTVSFAPLPSVALTAAGLLCIGGGLTTILSHAKQDHLLTEENDARNAELVRLFLLKRIHAIECDIAASGSPFERIRAAIAACTHAHDAQERHRAACLRRLESIHEAVLIQLRYYRTLLSDIALSIEYAYKPDRTVARNQFLALERQKARETVAKFHLALWSFEIFVHLRVASRLETALHQTAELVCCHRRRVLVNALLRNLHTALEELPKIPDLPLIPSFTANE